MKQFWFSPICVLMAKHLESRIYWMATKKQIQNMGLQENTLGTEIDTRDLSVAKNQIHMSITYFITGDYENCFT